MMSIENVKMLFNGIYNFEDKIIQHHLTLVLGGFLLGFGFCFIFMRFIMKKFHIVTFLVKTNAVTIDVEGKEEYCIKAPKYFSDLFLSLCSILYLKVTGEKVLVASMLLRRIVFVLGIIITISIIWIIITLTNSILIMPSIAIQTLIPT